jgi:hypothetical protein
MTNEQINDYIVAFMRDIQDNGWSGHTPDYIQGAVETLSHVNGLLTGSITVAK